MQIKWGPSILTSNGDWTRTSDTRLMNSFGDCRPVYTVSFASANPLKSVHSVRPGLMPWLQLGYIRQALAARSGRSRVARVFQPRER